MRNALWCVWGARHNAKAFAADLSPFGKGDCMSVLDIDGRPLPDSWIPRASHKHGAGTILTWDSLQNSVRSTSGPLGIVVDCGAACKIDPLSGVIGV